MARPYLFRCPRDKARTAFAAIWVWLR